MGSTRISTLLGFGWVLIISILNKLPGDGGIKRRSYTLRMIVSPVAKEVFWLGSCNHACFRYSCLSTAFVTVPNLELGEMLENNHHLKPVQRIKTKNTKEQRMGRKEEMTEESSLHFP